MSAPFDFNNPLIDLDSGLAIDRPLGLQQPPEYWVQSPGKEQLARILSLRQQLGITIDDQFAENQAVMTLPSATDYYKKG